MEHKVTGAQWDQEVGVWNLKVTDIDSGLTSNDSCDILINASGILNAWKWPEIPGIGNFKGPKVHSAAWDDAVDLNGKDVGLIGNGYH